MKLGEMRKEVANLVNDSSYNPENIDSYINEAIQYASGVVKLPALKRVGTVTFTADSYTVSLANLTDEIIGKITYAVLANGKELSILNGVEEMLMLYPTLAALGNPDSVALENQLLWYQPAAATTAMIVYYTRPPLLTKDTDTTTDFPAHLHRKLFVHGAAWMIFDQIEDGLEDNKKINTLSQFYHSFSEDNKHSGIVKLREWIAMNKVHHISSTWRY